MTGTWTARVAAIALLTAACGALEPGPVAPLGSDRAFDASVPSPSESGDADGRLVDIADLGPYFFGELGGEAAAALDEDRLEDAMRAFDDLAVAVEDPELTPRAQFLAAYLAARLGDHGRALRELPDLAHQLPAIADTAYETAARSAFALRRFDRAIELAGLVSGFGALAASAEMTAADALRRSGRHREAAAAYRALIAKRPAADGEDRSQARSRFVECAAQVVAGDDPDLELASEALTALETMRAQAPTSRWTLEAAAHEPALCAALGREVVERPRTRPAALEAYEDAVALMAKKRNKEAERAFNKAIKLAIDGGELECKARLDKGTVLSRQRAHSKAAMVLEAVADECADPNVRVRALFNGGKAYQAADRCADAIRLFDRLEDEFADHSFADDARLLGARCRLAGGDREAFRTRLDDISQLYPNGDMLPEALWISAHESLEAGELDRAREALERYHERFPVEEGWYAAGRSGYWLGRVEELLHASDAGAGRYEHVVASSPLSYYMVLAHARLAAADPGRAAALMARLAPPGGSLDTVFHRSLLEQNPGLAAGMELLRLGLVTRGRAELDAALSRPDASADLYWICAALLRRVGQFGAAREITAMLSESWKQRYPSGDDLGRWTVAYPTAFEAEVAAAAAESGVERALLWAVMREESGFNARVESWANAIGLMQLILPTARAMGRGLNLEVKKKTLRDPAVNIRLGAAYLAHLSKLFDDHPVLVIAAYNAGEGAVTKWARAHEGGDIDLFVERIPYSQTRGYTKRVLSSLATYRFLYEEDRPVLTIPLSLP